VVLLRLIRLLLLLLHRMLLLLLRAAALDQQVGPINITLIICSSPNGWQASTAKQSVKQVGRQDGSSSLSRQLQCTASNSGGGGVANKLVAGRHAVCSKRERRHALPSDCGGHHT
jgi:hypothetical protein